VANLYLQEHSMRHLTTILAALALTAFVGGTVASAAPGDAYNVKKAECKARADKMKFGVHFIKKNRWMNDCIAGRHRV
jgi:hypothetical protein